MKRMYKLLLSVAACLAVMPTQAQELTSVPTPTFTQEQQDAVQRIVESKLPEHMGVGSLKVRSLVLDNDSIKVDLSENFGDVPFTQDGVERMRDEIREALGKEFDDSPVFITIVGNDINKYFADYEPAYKRSHKAFISELDANRHYKHGLDGNIVAMWPSHGWYFEPKLNRWEWQRARLMQTVEDMYTHSYVLPFLIPMLENAGAYVWNARERDTHNIGAVVDNDGGEAQQGYSEHNGKQKWQVGDDAGFAFLRPQYKDFENPFAEGTYRMVKAEKDKKKLSTATWDVDMPEAGEFAIYISYKSLPNSASDVTYTVNSLSGTRSFRVDQKMAGGVWVYLGDFPLAKGLNKAVVEVSNLSSDKDAVITADAIKVGGGKGNIVRRVALPTEENRRIAAEQENEKYLGQEGVQYNYIGSGEHPWFHLGSRYFLQWAGFPDSVYSTSHGINDYTDDYRSRGEWVNYLAGGSDVLPDRGGLKVPVDISFCLHTDAGSTPDDEIVGTLLIYCTRANGKQFGKYANGTPRELSRRYCNLLSTEIAKDIRAKWEPNWTRRGMWDKSYYEARVPEVPAVLMELLSHQNFADMKYGLDPMFRFDVSRAIYKGMLKFIAQRDHRSYVVQPLPVNTFAISKTEKGHYLLTWNPTHDDLSDNADATSYIVCERVCLDGAFKEIATVKSPQYSVRIDDHKIHSYRIIAMNDGGRSFPSETLSLGEAAGSQGDVLVVNGFTRVSAPDWFDGPERAGFDDDKDHGVPYMQQINYLGSQYEFRRAIEWKDDDAPGFGSSRSDHETMNVAGNNFDYPSVHGEALMNAGYSFVSCSQQALEGGYNTDGYRLMDLILGKQKEIKTGSGMMPTRFKIYTAGLKDALRRFTAGGGSVLLSGAYVGSDLWDNAAGNNDEEGKTFVKSVLGFEHLHGRASLDGTVIATDSPDNYLSSPGAWTFVSKLNDKVYAVESPDAIRASDSRGFTWMRYGENGLPAAIASDRGNYRTVVVGFPLETVTTAQERTSLMSRIMEFLK
ncbi:MAG: N-acetylmuramoyl-L-alanine amidase [Muribaculaceae bacterium]|nr:N-acetylmuramoyl-L-alanine amidase [Muribaculaceae bacterium]